MTWKNARKYCKSKNANADLAEIHNAETNAFLSGIGKQKSSSRYWIGGSDESEVQTIQYSFLCQSSTNVSCNFFSRQELGYGKEVVCLLNIQIGEVVNQITDMEMNITLDSGLEMVNGMISQMAKSIFQFAKYFRHF